jgi:hypothetical protein
MLKKVFSRYSASLITGVCCVTENLSHSRPASADACTSGEAFSIGGVWGEAPFFDDLSIAGQARKKRRRQETILRNQHRGMDEINKPSAAASERLKGVAIGRFL